MNSPNFLRGRCWSESMTSWKIQSQEKHQQAKDHQMRERETFPQSSCVVFDTVSAGLLLADLLLCSWPLTSTTPLLTHGTIGPSHVWTCCAHTACPTLFKTVNKSLQSRQVSSSFKLSHRNWTEHVQTALASHVGSFSQSNSLPFKGNGMLW